MAAGGIMTHTRVLAYGVREVPMASNPLIGTWRLLSWETRSLVDGRVSYPLGEDAVGYIMYGQDG
jgi:hypothetical protein